MWRFFLAAALSAQPLPDSLWYIQPPNDTVLLATYHLGSFGWAATTYRPEGSSWRLLGTDTVFLDSQRRIISHVRYLDTAVAPVAPSLAPYERTEIVYPAAQYLTFTKYKYDRSQNLYLPRRRVHLWNTAQRWDSMLSGQFGALGLGWNFYNAERLWPFPALTHARDWGDSLLVEDFDASTSVFVEAGGYFSTGEVGGCDSLLLYEPPRAAPQRLGYYKQCYEVGGRLQIQSDSFCTPSECIAQERTLLYSSLGKPERDSVQIRFYTPQGSPLGSISSVRRYLWNSQGQLIEAEYPGGKYVLRYGGLVVALVPAFFGPELRFWGTGGQLLGGSPYEPLLLYDLFGRQVGRIAVAEGGYFTLPEGLPAGLYALRYAGHSWRIAVGL